MTRSASAKILSIANKIYDLEVIPYQMKQSIFIVIPKKGDLVEFKNYRLISLMIILYYKNYKNITKIILRVLLIRIRNKIIPGIGWEQFGFWKNKGTKNAIFTLQTIIDCSI